MMFLYVEMGVSKPRPNQVPHGASTVCSYSLSEPLRLANFIVVLNFLFSLRRNLRLFHKKSGLLELHLSAGVLFKVFVLRRNKTTKTRAVTILII